MNNLPKVVTQLLPRVYELNQRSQVQRCTPCATARKGRKRDGSKGRYNILDSEAGQKTQCVSTCLDLTDALLSELGPKTTETATQ